MTVRIAARRYVALAGVVALLLVAGLAAPAGYADPAPETTPSAYAVKYYVVRTSYAGQPEYLYEIAQRLLGDAKRYPEIFALNKDRDQPDGRRLTDPTVLLPGWVLVLPADASGDGVAYGPLPTGVAATGTPATSAAPSRTPTPRTTRTGCPALTAAAISPDQIPWPQLRLAPDQAWERSRGEGVRVAVIDSRVDTRAPALAGRVAAGMDLSSGAGEGASCAGHGTAVAGVLAAQPERGSGLVGIAPAATILPIRVDMPGGVIPSDQLVKAFDTAVSAGAAVIMVSRPVDRRDPALAAAISAATARDVVVVVPATLDGAPGSTQAGLLRVGAVGADDQLTRAYPEGAVDVVAPGADVVSLSADGSGQIRGSGTDFAVPFVAGLAALVRSAFPGLSATMTARRIEASAEHPSGQVPDPRYGWGMINPGAAVTATLTDEMSIVGGSISGDQGAATDRSSVPDVLLAGALLVCLLAVLAVRLRWVRRLLARVTAGRQRSSGDGAGRQ